MVRPIWRIKLHEVSSLREIADAHDVAPDYPVASRESAESASRIWPFSGNVLALDSLRFRNVRVESIADRLHVVVRICSADEPRNIARARVVYRPRTLGT